MISTGLIVLSVLVAITALIDVLLGDDNKQRVDKIFITLWNLLDEFRKVSLLRTLQSNPMQYGVPFFSAAIVCFYIGGASWIMSDRHLSTKLVIFLTTISVGLIFGTVVIIHSLRVDTIHKFVGRSLVFFAISLVPLLLAIGTAIIWSNFFRNSENSSFEPITLALISIYAYIPFTAYLIISYSVLFAFFCFMGLLYASEFLIRRIVEYPKGPILAVSALCAGLAALLKVFAP